MLANNLFIGIPIGALFCFLFILFCFLNMSKSKLVRYFRLVLVSCILWSGGVVFMRMQLAPGGDFWFQVSLSGMLLIMVSMYFFLFEILQIRKKNILYAGLGITIAAVVLNVFTGKVVETPQAILREKEVAYTYTWSVGTFFLVFMELFLLIYVTYLAHKQIGTELSLRMKLFPLLLGICFVFLGQMVEMLPGNIIPYGSAGGVLMALCFIYALYQQNLFDISNRLLIGCVYTVAACAVVFPMWNFSKDINSLQKILGMDLNDVVLAVLTGLTLWALLVIYMAWKVAEGLSVRKKKEQFQYLHLFQNGTASLFNEEELYRKISEVIACILPEVRTIIFIRKDKNGPFVLMPTCEADYGMEPEEKERIIALYEETKEKRNEFAELAYDDVIWGFVYLQFPAKVKMNYTEIEYFQQIAAYASICLKNISVYQEVYQNSIHDELTGLYNRTYYKEFIEKYWMPHAQQSMIYLDLDDFKLFNELYGENVGDEILKWCAKVISETVGAKGAIFRLGSNEFLIYSRYRGRDELLELTKEIQINLVKEDEKKPKALQPITVSAGIAFFPDTATDADMLLRQAERANYFAKDAGKNCIKVYELSSDDDGNVHDSRGYEQLTPTIYALTAAIDAKDSYTFKHSINVSEYAVLLAKKIGLSSEEVRIVKEAGLLHDIGKIGVPETILKKQGKLTDDEYNIMKSHVTNSIEMIHYLPNMSYVIPAVISHHERYDGRGYPRGIAGEKIPLLGRVLAVCDCYDAMVSKRPYKEKMPQEYAVSELIKNKGTQFDPKLVDAFVSLIREGKIE